MALRVTPSSPVCFPSLAQARLGWGLHPVPIALLKFWLCLFQSRMRITDRFLGQAVLSNGAQGVRENPDFFARLKIRNWVHFISTLFRSPSHIWLSRPSLLFSPALLGLCFFIFLTDSMFCKLTSCSIIQDSCWSLRLECFPQRVSHRSLNIQLRTPALQSSFHESSRLNLCFSLLSVSWHSNFS